MPKAGRYYLAQLEAFLYRCFDQNYPRKRPHLHMCKHNGGLGYSQSWPKPPDPLPCAPTTAFSRHSQRFIHFSPFLSEDGHCFRTVTEEGSQEDGMDSRIVCNTEKEDLLEVTKRQVRTKGKNIVKWLCTNKYAYIRDVDPSVIKLFKNAERFVSMYGLLLLDVPPEDLMNHVESAKSLRELFTLEFIQKQKEALYIGKQLPLLKDEARKRLDDQMFPCQNDGTHSEIDHSIHTSDGYASTHKGEESTKTHNTKRQEMIERMSFVDAFRSARVDASNLMEILPPTDIPALNEICNQWVKDISEFIRRDRSKNEEIVIPPQLDEKVLATETVRFALQLMCFPAYASDSKGNRGSFLRRMVQQPASNQVLLVNASVRLGEQISRIYIRTIKEAAKDSIQNDGQDDIHGSGSIHEGSLDNIQETPESDPAHNLDCHENEKHIPPRFTVTALSGASRASVMSNIANESLETIRTDGPLVDDLKYWNARQSAAVGGYLFNALVKSCYVQVDFSTALKQEKSLFIDKEFSLDDPLDGQTKRSEDAQAGKRHEKKIYSKIRRSRFDEGKVEIPAFTHRILRKGVRTYGTLEMKECCMLELRDAVARGLINLSCLPMVCEPRPWTTVSHGGSLLLKHYFIRVTNRASFDIRVFDLSNVFSITNSFGKVPWKISKSVFCVLKRLWDSDPTLPMRTHLPDRSCLEEPTQKDQYDWKDDYYYKSRRKEEEEKMKVANALSECSLFERRLHIAENFVHEPQIFLPLNIDFRGRMYPLSPYLNHTGDDVCRGLLTFSEMRPLGERGFFWLKVHIANLYGIDKLPFEDRVAWVENQMSAIEGLVKDPFSDTSQEFWYKAEKPFQFFGSATELVNAVHSRDPHKYLSSIPIQQDGSCNGLQHYSALGRDLNGGFSVNLLNNDTPQDVYKKVLLEVISKVTREFKRVQPSGNTSYDCAKLCIEHGLLKRKIVKQTVMTICYGVTRMGAIDQIEDKLKDEGSISHLSAHSRRRLANYIAGKVLGSIKTIFSEAMSIKKWLDSISSAHTKLNIPVTWISPIGLPCEQPYCKNLSKVVQTEMQAMRVAEMETANLDKRRQKMAFPPNFIHSLDASHLMFTAQEIFKTCTSFASVHDSYWIHADRVDLMHSEIRKGFVKMYKKPILQDLYSICTRRLGKGAVSEPPETGKLDIESVLESRYFFH